MSTSNSPDGTDITFIDQLNRLESKVDLLLRHLGVNAPGNVEESPPLSIPSRGEKAPATVRYGRLEGLLEHLLYIPELGKTICPKISGDHKLRIYFKEDESFLWYDEWLRLWAGIKIGDKHSCAAQQAIKTYNLDKQLFKPSLLTEEFEKELNRYEGIEK